MAKFNIPSKPRNQVEGGSVFPAAGTTSQTKTAVNHEGRTVWMLDEKSNLFFRATSAFAGQDTFYEKAAKRDEAMISLVRKLAVADWAWTCDFLVWLRSSGNMRTAPIMLAVEAVRARLDKKAAPAAGEMSHRALIAAVLQRADEPGEMLAYVENVLGRDKNAKPIKRGIGDAAGRLFNERNFLRYSSENRAIGFGGVIEMAQMQHADGWKNDLYRYAIGVQHKREQDIPGNLTAITARAYLNKMAPDGRHVFAKRAIAGGEETAMLADAMAGSWEWFMSWLGDAKGSKTVALKDKWGFAAQHMGIMAIVRNLRNFDEAGITLADPVAQDICARLMNEEQIAKSRMFPFRFFTAHLQLKSVTWTAALEMALQHSLKNIPEMPGKTLVLVDTSGSMQSTLSSKSVMSYVQCAALFGVALKVKNPDAVSLWGFATGQFEAQATRGHSVLRCTEEFVSKVGIVGHGTEMAAAVRATYKEHDRVIIISDMQAFYSSGYSSRYDVAGSVPKHVPVYGYNLASSSTTPLGQGNRHSLGGLTDATFKLIPQHEKAGRGEWPWQS